MKKMIKIAVIVLSVIIVLIAAVILLLSIFFPSELVRKEIEKQGTAILGTEVRLKKLSFNIFTGLELSGFSISQIGKNWNNPLILDIQSARLKYRLFPLIYRTLSIKECVIEKGTIDLERTKNGANWDYFLKKFSVNSNSKNEISVKSKPKEESRKEAFKNSSLPIELDINRVGIDGLSLNYYDSTLFDIPARLDVSNLRLMANNVHVLRNTPAGLDGRIKFVFDAGDHINLYAEAKASGSLKLFDDSTHEVSPTGPLTLRLDKAGFQSKDIKGMLQKVIADITEKNFGPTVKQALSNTKLIADAAGKYFDNLDSSSDGIIRNSIKNTEDLIAKKSEISEYGNNTVKDQGKYFDSQTGDVDEKINSIDGKISAAIDGLSKIPGVNSRVDFNSYRKKASEIKTRASEKKKELTSSSKNALAKNITSTLAANFPKQIPDYKSLKNQFASEVAKHKKNITGELKKYSISGFIDSLMPDLSFLDREIAVSDLSTTVMINKKSKNANDIKIVTDYFNASGKAVISDKNYLDYSGNVTLITGKFNLPYFPVERITAGLKVTGVIPQLKVTVTDFPEIKIDAEKQKELMNYLINNFLANNYGSEAILKPLLKGISPENINIDKIKKLIDENKSDSIAKFVSNKEELKNSIDKDAENLINEMKKKAEENIKSPVNLPKLFP
jgi:hypothetical protein